MTTPKHATSKLENLSKSYFRKMAYQVRELHSRNVKQRNAEKRALTKKNKFNLNPMAHTSYEGYRTYRLID